MPPGIVRDVVSRDGEGNPVTFLYGHEDAIETVTVVLLKDGGSDRLRFSTDELRSEPGLSGRPTIDLPYRLFDVLPPTSPPGVQPRGVVLHMPGLAQTRYEAAVRDAMRERGGWVIQARAWNGLGKRLMVMARDSDRGETAAEAVAAFTDRTLARLAQEWSVVLDDVVARRPDLAGLPRVVMGYSAGAISGVTVAAINRERIDAAVFVGGGVNVAAISNQSSFASLFSVLHVNEREGGAAYVDNPPGPLLRNLERLYLDASRLDPHHTAPALTGVPTLVLHSRGDTWVPAATGDAMWERLGEPERWSLPFDHDFLFWRLPAMADEIASWVDTNAPARD